jgi:hypothetical protein
MKVQKICTFLLSWAFLATCVANPVLYEHQEPTLSTLPDRFRIAGHEPFKRSGSAQFSKTNLQRMLELYPGEPLIIVDLRAEFHGFQNGNPIDWRLNPGPYQKDSLQYNFDRSRFDMLDQEAFFLEQKPEILSEQQLIASLKAPIQYMRIPITDHHVPSDEETDFFITWFKQLPSSAWVHFHCAGGKGRTAVLLCMIDMLHYSHLFSAQELMKKQQLLGGSTLHPSEGKVFSALEEKRYQFLCLFHQYCLETKDSFKSWSSWLASRSS